VAVESRRRFQVRPRLLFPFDFALTYLYSSLSAIVETITDWRFTLQQRARAKGP
jgi:hypothetical protein